MLNRETVFGWLAGISFAGFLSVSPPLPAQIELGGGVSVEGVRAEGNTKIYDLSWKPSRTVWKTSQAWAVVPEKIHAGPGILFFHQLGQNRDRNQFLPEALDLAQLGVRSVLINGNAPWTEGWKGTAEDADMIEAQIADRQIAVGILRQLPGTDSNRLAFVGHDYGAMFGALLYGRSAEFKAYCLIAPAPQFADWIFFFNQGAAQDKPAYSQLLGGRDPMVALSGPQRFPLLFQFSNSDTFVSNSRSEALIQAAAGSTVQRFSASHNSVAQKGKKDRYAWLLPLLGVEP